MPNCEPAGPTYAGSGVAEQGPEPQPSHLSWPRAQQDRGLVEMLPGSNPGAALPLPGMAGI